MSKAKPAKSNKPSSTKMDVRGFHSAKSSDGSKEKRGVRPAEIDTPPPSRVVVPIEDGDIDDKGSYEAMVYIYDPGKGNGAGGWRKKKSSMFPDDWSKEKVAAEIREAYKTASDSDWEDIADGKKRFRSTNASGVTVQGVYNPATDTIETAYTRYPNA